MNLILGVIQDYERSKNKYSQHWKQIIFILEFSPSILTNGKMIYYNKINFYTSFQRFLLLLH